MTNPADPKPADNLTWHQHRVTCEDRENAFGHKGATLWFTGLSGSGKSTLANEVAHALHLRGVHTYVLDGDNIRQGLNRGLGFSPADRTENIRRIGEVSRLFTDAGVINLTAFVSPYREDRAAARALAPEPDRFLEVWVKADVETCASRDPKGLYRRAMAGEISGFTGVSADAPYEEPLAAEIVVETARASVDQCVSQVLAELERRGIIPTTATN